jgi:hypothetical protein
LEVFDFRLKLRFCFPAFFSNFFFDKLFFDKLFYAIRNLLSDTPFTKLAHLFCGKQHTISDVAPVLWQTAHHL